MEVVLDGDGNEYKQDFYSPTPGVTVEDLQYPNQDRPSSLDENEFQEGMNTISIDKGARGPCLYLAGNEVIELLNSTSAPRVGDSPLSITDASPA